MTTELVVQDFAGFHNGQFEEGRSRIIESGSWKRQRTIIIVPSAEMIPAKVALSLWNLSFPPNNPTMKILAIGTEVGEAYS